MSKYKDKKPSMIEFTRKNANIIRNRTLFESLI